MLTAMVELNRQVRKIFVTSGTRKTKVQFLEHAYASIDASSVETQPQPEDNDATDFLLSPVNVENGDIEFVAKKRTDRQIGFRVHWFRQTYRNKVETMASPFEELKRLASESGIAKSLDFLEHHFRKDKEYFKLFEVLKMRCRHRMGLPLMYTNQPDDLDDKQQKALEDGLIEACREIGTLLIKNGKLQEGWMYLQPVGDKELSDKLLRSVKVEEDNIDTVIEIAVTQGAAPAYGYRLLLEHYGTCNGITTFDTQANRFDQKTQSEMATVLLRHLYDELMSNLRYSLDQNGQKLDEATSLSEAMKQHPGLLAGGAHHIDTTHLASLMRIARTVSDQADLKKAAELAEYGSQLAEDFQYPGPPPFENTYVDHKYFYNALLGVDEEAAIQHFSQKMDSISVDEYGPVAIETLVQLLVRLERHDEALGVTTERLLGKHEPMGIAPSAFEIANNDEHRDRLMKFFQGENDLLGYAVSLLSSDA